MLMVNYILEAWFGGSLISGFLAIVIGSLIGVIAGAIAKRIKQTIFPAVLGSFVGVMWICIIPLYGTPGAMQGWGMGGGLGSLLPMFMIIGLGPIGAVTGGIAGSTVGFKFVQGLSSKKLLQIIGIVYLVVALFIFLSFSLVCLNSQPGDWYCQDVGF